MLGLYYIVVIAFNNFWSFDSSMESDLIGFLEV